jgi:hypothetical protein
MSLVYTYDYDTVYNPAMPVVEIEIGRAMADVSLSLTALVDSGVDATIIPLRYLRQIQARHGRTAWMRGTTGVGKLVMLYAISLQLGFFRQAHLEVVGDDEHDEIIVGRDVLNHLAITLDGPGSSVQIAA